MDVNKITLASYIDAGQGRKDWRLRNGRVAYMGSNHDCCFRYFIININSMKKIEIITDEHRHHVYIGNIDFWLDTLELVKLYKKLGRVNL